MALYGDATTERYGFLVFDERNTNTICIQDKWDHIYDLGK